MPCAHGSLEERQCDRSDVASGIHSPQLNGALPQLSRALSELVGALPELNALACRQKGAGAGFLELLRLQGEARRAQFGVCLKACA